MHSCFARLDGGGIGGINGPNHSPFCSLCFSGCGVITFCMVKVITISRALCWMHVLQTPMAICVVVQAAMMALIVQH